MKVVMLGLPMKPTLLPSVDDNQAAYGFASQIGIICKALYERGHEVLHVGVSGSDVPCSKHIDVVSRETLERVFVKRELSVGAVTAEFNANANYVLKQLEPNSHIVCVNERIDHFAACKDVQQFLTETCVGYPLPHIWTKYRSFMSNAWMHAYYGSGSLNPQGSWYDAVIPPCFDVSTFPYEDKKDDYFLMVCRLVDGKGIRIAIELADKMGFKLKLAGPGDPKPYLGNPNVEYLGVLGPKARNEVMSKAKALFSPSTYVEPFGMAVIEANLCGTPVITTDFGAFTETVQQGITGYRCRNWKDFKHAVEDIEYIQPRDCYVHGKEYSYENIVPQYERYFQDLLNINGKGWYTE